MNYIPYKLCNFICYPFRCEITKDTVDLYKTQWKKEYTSGL